MIAHSSPDAEDTPTKKERRKTTNEPATISRLSENSANLRYNKRVAGACFGHAAYGLESADTYGTRIYDATATYPGAYGRWSGDTRLYHPARSVRKLLPDLLLP